MANVVGLINLHSDVSLKGLTERRPVASVSFLGRYGVIDFVLSNFSNSRIDKVGILVKEKQFSCSCLYCLPFTKSLIHKRYKDR